MRGRLSSISTKADPLGGDRPSPLGPPASGSRRGEFVPLPGNPDKYPFYLKPIPFNTRDIEDELLTYLRQNQLDKFNPRKQPRLARWLYSTWNAERDAIKFQELRNALRDGQTSRAWLSRWQADYATFINEQADPFWRQAIQAGAQSTVGSLAARLEPGAAAIVDFLDSRGGELITNLPASQHRAVRSVMRHLLTERARPVTVPELGRFIRPVIGLTEKESRFVVDFIERLRADGVPVKRIEHLAGNYSGFLKRRRAHRIARTEAAFAWNYGALEAVRAADRSGVLPGPVVKFWLTARDERVCPICGALDGAFIGLDETFPVLNRTTYVPPAHPHCLPGDSLITTRGRVTGAAKRWFDGDMVIVRTAAGRVLASTPNHPILTRRGWVAAQFLNHSDKVIRHLGREGVPVVDADHDDIPASIEDIAESFFRSRKVRTVPMPVTAEDFHGDGEGSEIAIIGTERELRGHYNPTTYQRSVDHVLQFRNSYLALMPGLGDLAQMLKSLFCPAHGVMGGGGLALAGGGVHAVPFDSFGLGLGAHDNPGSDQAARDDIARDAKIARQLITGNAGEVITDQIVNIDCRDFSGHVYNLETVDGWYSCNDIITHNCRCTVQYRVMVSRDYPHRTIEADPDAVGLVA